MELKEILEQQVEVKNYKNDKPCDFRKLLKRADSGNVKAMYDAVQTINYNGLAGEDPDDEMLQRQLAYIKKLTKIKRYKYMCIFMGDAYAKGTGVKKDIKKAIRWYKKAAKAGIKFGNECIGMIYFNGTEVPADYEKAYAYFTKDDGNKSFCTRYALGEMYRQGLYVEQDAQKAWDYYTGIATDRSPYYELDDYYWRACYRLGSLYLDTAAELIDTAKRVFDERGYEAIATDITKREIDQKWKLVKKAATDPRIN